MSDAHWDLLKKIVSELWPVVTLLLGILVGGLVSSRNQRRQWVSDTKCREYRELMSAMTRAIALAVNAPGATTVTEQQARRDAEGIALSIIQDRIFIAKEIKELKVLERWHALLDAIVQRTGALDEKDFDKLKEDIINEAMKSI